MGAAAAWAEATTPLIPAPTDSPQVRTVGVNTVRLLLIGSGPSVGRGVISHSLALPGALARALTATTGRGVVVDVVADPAMLAGNAITHLVGTHLHRYDAVVLTLGTNEALHLTPVARWAADLARLMAALTGGMGVGGTVYFTGLRPMRTVPQFDSLIGTVADRHARHLDRVAQILCDEMPQCVYVPPLSPPTISCTTADRYRTAEQYRIWAHELVSQILPGTLHPAPARPPIQRDREAAPVSPVDGVDWDEATHDPVLHRLTDLARQKLDVQSVVITLLEHDRQHHLAISGKDVPEVPGQSSFSATTARLGEPLLVRNAPEDARFCNHPMVAGDTAIRFYVGCPITTPDGQPIGAFSALDPTPRPNPSTGDVTYLGELAMLAGDQLQTHLHLDEAPATDN
jgi:hypothetical protein